MMPVPTGVRVWLGTGYTDMRRGFPTLALQVQEVLRKDPLSDHLVRLPRSPQRSFEGDLALWPGSMPVYQLCAFILQLLQLQLRALAPLPS